MWDAIFSVIEGFFLAILSPFKLIFSAFRVILEGIINLNEFLVLFDPDMTGIPSPFIDIYAVVFGSIAVFIVVKILRDFL